MYRHKLMPPGLHTSYVSGHPSAEVKLERLRMLTEELAELTAAMQTEAPIHEVADALGDLFYVLIGTFIAYNVPLEPVFDEIHRSNMTKEVASNTNTKPIKGAAYEPPRLQEILASWRTRTNSSVR